MKGYLPHLWLIKNAKVKQNPRPVIIYFHCKRMPPILPLPLPPKKRGRKKKKKDMHQAISLLGNTVTLWHTVQNPPTLLEAQVRSASICEEWWEERPGMKKRVHPASMLRSVCFCYSLKGYSWVVPGTTMCPRPLTGFSLRSRSLLDIPYRQKNMYHVAITYYRSNAARI